MIRPLILSLALTAALAASASAQTLTGRIIHVSDGDTVTLLTQESASLRIRVSGIDAPEKKQAWGARSRQAMMRCAYGKTAQVETHKKDRYGRLVGVVTADGTDCGLALLKSGLAWFYSAYERELPAAKRPLYCAAEKEARQKKRGLWQDNAPQAPWEWRKAQKAKAAAPSKSRAI